MLRNITKNNIIVKKVEVCNNIWRKALGLMFSRKIKDKCLIFVFKKEQYVPLHMLFVFYPIDVLFLNKKKKVVEMKKNFFPFTAYNPVNKSKYVIELPAGKSKDISLMDEMEW